MVKGNTTGYEEGSSPLDALHQAAVNYATAITVKPNDPKPHFLLGQVLEEHYYAAEIYGLKKKQQEEAAELSTAKATGRQEEILAICKLHGIQGRPALEQQLKALDAEYHQLKDQGQSEKADYIQTLFTWKSKQAGKDMKCGAAVTDEESSFGQALMKYLDALSLNLDNWQYNFHVGRMLLLHRRNKEALTYLQEALGLRPAAAITRCYVGLALLEQDGGPSNRMEEAIVYLQQGLEHLINQLLNQSEKTQQSLGMLNAENLFSLTNAHLLQGILKMGNQQSKLSFKPSVQIQTAQNTLHIAASLAAKALCFCQYLGAITEQLEWVLLEAHYGLLELLMEEPKGKEHLIHKRCQALSALLRLTSIPACQELLDMQEKI
ncbi:uncharacterized protein LOC122792347 [Protopterus annectens]|uniref:uncharacterized protein LOC122792347 n=1 Tax=Protopterus annectens TaxID=7888 RepID=UPI001CF99359|nr:uncharacterized protein LOC122792347 [Protopterus annectens]